MSIEVDSPKFKIVAAGGEFNSEGELEVNSVIGFSDGPMHPAEISFDVAEQTGVPPENMVVKEMGAIRGSAAKNAGRVSVGFSSNRWKSNWQPGMDKDGSPILH
jgi:hypothetical protein